MGAISFYLCWARRLFKTSTINVKLFTALVLIIDLAVAVASLS